MKSIPVRVGINGFGRIGRTFCRALWHRRGEARAGVDVEVVAVNDVVAAEQLAYLLAADSIAGGLAAPVEVEVDGANGRTTIRCGEHSLSVLRASTPDELPWRDLGVDVVLECSRRFGPAAEARRHVERPGGASRVVVSAVSEGADATFVVGVNDDTFDAARHRVVSNASCTTNCLAPMARVLDEAFGIDEGLMTTVHAYTSDQALVDGAGPGSLRDVRAAALNVIPSSTGAARATRLVLPRLAGRLDGSSLRVPVADGSITDLTVVLGRAVDRDEVNEAFRAAAGSGPLAGVLDYSERPLVSSDIVGNPASCVFDAPLTLVSGASGRGRLVKVFGWYDNEWGYSNRLVDLVATVGAVAA
jgi:glyceraldehyde 3-phosphate dehydrogenase